MKILTLGLQIFIPIVLFAQNPDDIRKKYPESDFVLLKQLAYYKITVNKDTPRVESTEQEQWMYLTDNGAMLKEGRIYHSGFHKLSAFDAYTITPSGKKVKVTDIKTTSNNSSGVFYDDGKVTSFNFPSLIPGSVSFEEYSLEHTNPYLLSPHYFSHAIPTLYNELKISVPKTIKLKYLLKGISKDLIMVNVDSRRNETILTFSAQDLPAEKSYPDAPAGAYWATHIVFFIEKFQKENGDWVNYLSTPQDLYNIYAGFLKNINKELGPELKNITDSITRGKKNDREKASSIYSWVQNNIKYVAFEDGMEGFIPQDANLVCHRRYGDCKDMASILTMMLKFAGLHAYYTWIGTRSLPYTYEETPTPIVDNHMISTLELNGEYIFLDGTDNTCIFGIPADHIQNKEAMIAINEQEYKIIKVPVLAKTENQVIDTTFISFSEKGIKGSIHLSMKGYYATSLQNTLTYVDDKEKEKYFRGMLSRGSNKFSLDGYSILENPATRNELSVTANFDLPDYGKTLADDKFINMNLFRPFEHEEIDYPKRKIPIEFKFKSDKKYITILQIPDGYEVDYLPESKEYYNDVWGFSIRYEKKDTRVIMIQEFANDHILLSPDKFSEWNKVLEQLFPMYKETVSLSRTSLSKK
jgi:hypothetical protein